MKYTLTDNTITTFDGIVLHQIRAEKDFAEVKKGDLGGWIEKKSNLSQDGEAWVYGEARVCGKACVCGEARVCGNAWVYGNARIDCHEDWATLTLDGSTITLFRNETDDGEIGVTVADGDGRLHEFSDVVNAMMKIFVLKMEAAHNEES